MFQKLSKIALKSFLQTSGNIKFSRGRSPEPPYTPPTRAFGTHFVNAVFDLSWPDHFSKADDGPELPVCSGVLVCFGNSTYPIRDSNFKTSGFLTLANRRKNDTRSLKFVPSEAYV